MELLFTRCAGIDVHKRTVVACRIVLTDDGEWLRETRTFGTATAELLRLSDWLGAGGCTHVGVESTGEYWKLCFPRKSPSPCVRPAPARLAGTA